MPSSRISITTGDPFFVYQCYMNLDAFIAKNHKDTIAIYNIFRRILSTGNERSFKNIRVTQDNTIAYSGRYNPNRFRTDVNRFKKKYYDFFISDMLERTDEYHDTVVSMEIDRLGYLGNRRWH